jgi:hypothetical protein
MSYEPEHLARWTLPDNYFGAEWPEYYVYFGRHRDSNLLTNINFDVALEAVGGESETVQVVRESHWAVGWVEWIAIHETDTKALQKADEIMAAYYEYPCLNEERLSEAEFEEAHKYWDRMPLQDRIEECREAGVSIFAARHDELQGELFDNIREYVVGA